MFIRNLFIALAVLTTTLLVVLGGWQIRDSQAKVRAVDWLHKSSLLVSTIQQTSAELAVERGLGTQLIESLGSMDERLWQRVQHQQTLVNRLVQQLQQQLNDFIVLAPNHPVEPLPQVQLLQKERQQFEQELLGYYLLRNDILTASNAEQPYRVVSDEWFTQATRTIAAVYRISALVEQEMRRNMDELKHNAEQARYMVLFVMVLLAVAAALGIYLLKMRILSPLSALVGATQKITSGNLQERVAPQFNDEIGTLATALEQMRQQLYADQQQQQQHSQELRKLYTAVEQSVAAILITDCQGVVEYTNSHFEQVTGYSLAELKGQKAGVWRSGETSEGAYQDMWSTIQAGHVWVGELLNKRKNGELYWAMVSISPVCDEQGEITHFIDFHLDISEHKRVAERLNFVSHYNQTTNLPNRQLLLQRYVHDRTGQPQALAVVSFRIGRLKSINDSLGWIVGDQVLREVGLRLKARLSIQDVLSHQEGGKFTVLLHNIDNDSQAIAKAEAMLTDLRQWVHVQHHQLQLAPIAGIALGKSHHTGFEHLLKNADLALHYAEQTNEAVRVYSNEMDISAQQRLALENALHLAVKNQQLELHYQPKVALSDGHIFGLEALVRWRDQAKGQYISPVVFIPIAEANGLIHELGEWVLNEACRQAKQWQQQNLPPLVMAVNVSVEQLKNPKFPTQVQAALERYELDPAWLELELTESLFLENPKQAQSVLSALKNIGVKLALDDFGTGYSSLSYLSWLPVDTLKIDKSFIHNITSDLRAATVATSVIALGHRMGLKVIAEGVETQAQLKYLAQHQCDEIQGYYFSRPLPAAQIDALLCGDIQMPFVQRGEAEAAPPNA